MKIEAGMNLMPKDANDQDGTTYRVENIIVKNNVLERLCCQAICAGFKLGTMEIGADDVNNYEIIKPIAFNQ